MIMNTGQLASDQTRRRQNPDRIGSDRIGSDRIGSRIGSDHGWEKSNKHIGEMLTYCDILRDILEQVISRHGK